MEDGEEIVIDPNELGFLQAKVAEVLIHQVRHAMANHPGAVDQCLESIEAYFTKNFVEQIVIGRQLIEKIMEFSLKEEIEELTK